MKIAFLNPWENAAENQAYQSLLIASKRLGHELIDCRIAEDVERAAPDFVISVASSIPKVADFPTYLTVHEPTRRFLESPFYLQNLLTYDGYLTISDTLDRFLRNLCFGVGRDTEIGFYYNTPQKSMLQAKVTKVVAEGKLRITYLGTNWDRRMPALFKELDASGILRIHGPRQSWEHEGFASYAGALPFDGLAPQKAYAECGLGLVLLSEGHLREDIISNRIFEIASVGAVAICPDIPWIRKWFGDTVLYFDPVTHPRRIARQVIKHYEFCLKEPEIARTKGEAARLIFEKNFAAEKMIGNAISYHERKQQIRTNLRARTTAVPHISVVVRCGGRPVSMVKQAVESIRRQTYGKFTVIFSKYRELDLSELTADRSGNIVTFVEVLTDGGNRAATLTAGLKCVNSEFFAILDDDDFWLSDHVETLFAAAIPVDRDFDVAYSGSIAITREKIQIEKSLAWDRNVYTFGINSAIKVPRDITSSFSSNCFVARSSVLGEGLIDLGELSTAEDSLLISIITRRKPPIFSYRATAFFRRGFEGESDFALRQDRAADEMAWALRAGMLLAPRWVQIPAMEIPMKEWSSLRDRLLLPTENQSEEPPCKDLERLVHYETEEAEGWDVTPLLSTGAAGRRLPKGIATLPRRQGHVCYGPYLHLQAGNYRVEFKLSELSEVWPSLGFGIRKERQRAGTVEVVSVDPEWIGGQADFFRAETIVLPFTIPTEFNGGIECRVFSSGTSRFIVKSIILWRLW